MHLLCVSAISGLHILSHKHTSCLSAISMSPMEWEVVFMYTPPPPPPPLQTHTQLSSHVSFPFSPQSNYLASEGGNLLSLVAPQVPIRGNVLRLYNELITLNESKALCLEKKRRRQVGIRGIQEAKMGMWACKQIQEKAETSGCKSEVVTHMFGLCLIYKQLQIFYKAESCALMLLAFS